MHGRHGLLHRLRRAPRNVGGPRDGRHPASRARVVAEVAERLYQEGVGPHRERIIQHAIPKSDEDQAAAEAAAVARYREEHPFASASEINAERTRIRATSPGISRPYYDVTSSASKSVSLLHASLRVAAGQAREVGDAVKAAALDGEAQVIEDSLVREGLELLEAMACYVRTGHHSKDTGEWRDGKGLVATSWVHTISRDGDPLLHVHLAVLSAVQRADGADDQWRRRRAAPLPAPPPVRRHGRPGLRAAAAGYGLRHGRARRRERRRSRRRLPAGHGPVLLPAPRPSTASSARGSASTRPRTAIRRAGARST